MGRNELLSKINEIVRRLEKLLQNRAVFPIEKPSDQKALLDAVNTASNSARNGWIFFVALMAFFFVTILSVSHRDLLLDTPVQLPFLLIGIPLTRFFMFAPIVMVFVHIRLILQHALLAHKIRKLDELLNQEEKGNGPRSHPLRQLLSTYIYSQMLGGPERVKFLNIVLQTITVGTLIILPLMLLMGFQIIFLPYHDPDITGLHQFILCFEALFLGTLGIYECFPNWHYWGGSWRRISQRIIAQFIPAMFILSTILFSIFIATLPDSALEQLTLKTKWVVDVPVNPKLNYYPAVIPTGKFLDTGVADSRSKRIVRIIIGGSLRKAFYPTAMMLEGEVNYVTGKSSSWFSRNLVLPSLKFHPIRTKETRLDLRGRDLRYAVLDKADLRFADLTGAKLDGASLIKANLSHALLQSAAKGRSPAEISVGYGRKRFNASDKEQIALFKSSQEQKGFKVSVTSPQPVASGKKQKYKVVSWRLPNKALEPTTLTNANLTEADLSEADLSLAIFYRANLTKANLSRAKLANSRLEEANLFGAVLIDVDLRGVNLTNTNFNNAQIIGANLQSTNLETVSLNGAYIISTNLQGASLVTTDMSGSKIFGTKLKGAKFQGALLIKATIWNSDISNAKLGGVNFDKATIWRLKPLNKIGYRYNNIKDIKILPPDQKLINKIKKMVKSAGNRLRNNELSLDLDRLIDEKEQSDWENTESYKEWNNGLKLARSLDHKNFLKGWAKFLGRLACHKPVFTRTIVGRLYDGFGEWSSFWDYGGFEDFGDYGYGDLDWDTLPLPSNALVSYISPDEISYDLGYGSKFLYTGLNPALVLEKLKSDKCGSAKTLSPKIYSDLELAVKAYRKRQKKKSEPTSPIKPEQ